MKTIIPHPPLPCCTPIITTRSSIHFLPSLPRYSRTVSTLACSASSRRQNLNGKDFDIDIIKEHQQHLDDDDDDDDVIDIDYKTREGNKDIDIEQLQVQEDEGEDGDVPYSGSSGRQEEKDFDRDPEFAEILGGYLDNPQKAQSKMEARLRRKRNKILQSKTGSGIPMKVSVQKFDFSNSYIWFEFYNAPLPKDISLICDAIQAWHIVGRLGGCNSMNMQLSQSPMDKRPSYDYIQGANVTPTTFYNIGDLEVQDNLARIWVDIGTSEPLLLDVLINALTQISSDVVGIKQVVFGGDEFENWEENLTSEDSGFSVHKI